MMSKEQMISLVTRHVRIDVRSFKVRRGVATSWSSCRTSPGQHRLMECPRILQVRDQNIQNYTKLGYGKATASPKKQTVPWEIVKYLTYPYFMLGISDYFRWFQRSETELWFFLLLIGNFYIVNLQIWKKSISLSLMPSRGPDGIAGDKFLELFKDRMWTVTTYCKEAADCALVEKSQPKKNRRLVAH